MRNLTIIAVLVIAFSGIIYSCTHSSPPATSENVRSEIEKLWEAFSDNWENENAGACAALYAPDGLNVPPQMDSNKGREAIEKFYQSLFDNNLGSEYTHTTKTLTSFGDHAVEYGEFAVNWLSNDSTSWTYNARAMVHWTKSETGEWLIETLLFNQVP